MQKIYNTIDTDVATYSWVMEELIMKGFMKNDGVFDEN